MIPAGFRISVKALSSYSAEYNLQMVVGHLPFWPLEERKRPTHSQDLTPFGWQLVSVSHPGSAPPFKKLKQN